MKNYEKSLKTEKSSATRDRFSIPLKGNIIKITLTVKSIGLAIWSHLGVGKLEPKRST